MALTASVEYETLGPTIIVPGTALSTADTYYKSAIVNISPEGYIKVAADVTHECPLGVVAKETVVTTSAYTTIPVEVGMIWIAYSSAAQGDVGQLWYASADDTIASSATNVGPLGIAVAFKSGYLLIDTRQKNLAA